MQHGGYIKHSQSTTNKMLLLLNLFISVRRSTCFRRFCCTSSYLKHVQRLTEINKPRNAASSWLYSANILAMHGPMNVRKKRSTYVSKLFSDRFARVKIRLSTSTFNMYVPSTSTLHQRAAHLSDTMVLLLRPHA